MEEDIVKGVHIQTLLLCALFVVLEGGASAQATAPPAFSLGAASEDTYRDFGLPNQWYVSRGRSSGSFLNSSLERDAALQVYGVRAVGDVYMRDTSTNQPRFPF